MTGCIYDFETLSNDAFNGVVLNIAAIKFDEKRFNSNPYTFEELVDSAKYMKFNVEEQVRTYGRVIKQSTLDWWREQGPEAQKQVRPSKDDVSIAELYEFLSLEVQIQNCDRVYTRGNTFDPILVATIMQQIGREDPTRWWTVRDTRSLFDGMTYGHGIKSTFIPEGLESKFTAHDAKHDVAMDVMRFQYLARLLSDG